MDRPESSRLLSFLRRRGLALLLAAGLYYLTFTAVVSLFRTDNMADYPAHTLWAIALTPQSAVASFYTGRERLWHICVRIVFSRTHNMQTACAFVTALANAVAYYITFRYVEKAYPKDRSRWLLAVLLGAVFIANAVTVPGCPFVTDRGYVNTWHNPTNIMVRPFAAAAFFMTLRIYNRRRSGIGGLLVSGEAGGQPFSFADSVREEWRRPILTRSERVLYPLVLLFSVYAKPSFLQYFAPAIFCFLVIDLIRTKGRLFPFCVKLAIAFLPAVLVILSQFLHYFGGFTTVAEAQASADALRELEAAAGGTVYYDTTSNFDSSHIAFYYILPSFSGAGEFLRETANAILLTLYVCAFPLAVFLIDLPYARRSAACRLSFIGMIAARLESLFFHELGVRINHGNFRWGYYVSIWLLWIVAMERYAEGAADRGRRGKLMLCVATPLLLWHLAVGVIYLERILTTFQYWF